MMKLKALTAAVLVTLSAGAFAAVTPVAPTFPVTILSDSDVADFGDSSFSGIATWNYASTFSLDLTMFGVGSDTFSYTLSKIGGASTSPAPFSFVNAVGSKHKQYIGLSAGMYSFSYNVDMLDGSSAGLTLKSSIAPMAPVPEPETYAMLLAGLGLMGAIAKRRKDKQA